jgi:hypothetical protein
MQFIDASHRQKIPPNMRSPAPKHKKLQHHIDDATKAVQHLQGQLAGLQAQHSGLMIKVSSSTEQT